MKSKIMGVILAAGKGSRMYPLSEKVSKCTLPICNKPLLDYQIEMMKDVGIRDIIILVGYNGFEVVRVIGNGERQGVRIKYVNQEENLGIAHALGRLEPYVERSFLLFLGDIYFVCPSLMPMLEIFARDDVHAVLATKEEPNPDAIKRNFAIILNQDGSVRRVIEKPRHIENNIKGCGLYLFDLHIFDAIRRTPRTAMRDEYEITESIQILIDDEYRVMTSNIIQEDLNLTFVEDLLELNLFQLKKMKEKVIIGEQCNIPEKIQLENVIVGDNVVIKHPISIKNSIIFSNSVVEERGEIRDSIIDNNQTIHCMINKTRGWRG